MARRVGLALGAVALLAACSSSGPTTAPTSAPTTGAVSSLGPSSSTTTVPTSTATTAPATSTSAAAGDGAGGGADQASQVTALATANGASQWQADAGGVASQVPPAISGGVVAVVVCPSNGSSAVVGFDVGTGARRWQDAGPSCGAAGSLPVLPIGDGLLAAATSTGVAALAATDGRPRWTADLGAVPQSLAGDASGLVADEDGQLVGLDPATGKERWRLDGGDAGVEPAAGSGTLVVAVPDDAGTSLVVTSYDLVSGAPRWHVSLAGTDVQIALSQPLLVLAVTGPSKADPSVPATELMAFDARTGAPRWRQAEPGATGTPIVTEPSTGQAAATLVQASSDVPRTVALDAGGKQLWTTDGVVATATGAGLVVAVSADGSALVALDAASGKERWRSQEPASVGGVSVTSDAVVSLVTPGGSD